MDRLTEFTDQISARIARTIDRRAFFRKAAVNAFKAAAVLTAGGTLAEVISTPAWANDCGTQANFKRNNGLGCPAVYNVAKNHGAGGYMYPCGPSRCCNYTKGMSSSCNCWNGSNCKRNHTCRGRENGQNAPYPGTGSWTCVYTSAVSGNMKKICTTTCNDCLTIASCPNPGNPAHHRCVGWTLDCRWITT
jgi:hypothetical protein